MQIFAAAINEKMRSRLAADPVAVQNTRWGRLPLVLSCSDGSSFSVTFDQGKLADGKDIAPADVASAVRIDGTAAQWGVILGGLHGGLHRAWRYHLLAFSGDRVRMMTYWKTIWRVSEALQKIRKGGL